MYRLSEEFTFKINSEGVETNFIGQLIFKGRSLNELGTLYTQEQIAMFSELLTSIAVPQEKTLEAVAKAIFDCLAYKLPTLNAVNLSIVEQPQRVAEYSIESNYVYSDNILELETVN